MNTLPSLPVDGQKTQEYLADRLNCDQTHIANLMAQGAKEAVEALKSRKWLLKDKEQKEEPRRESPVERKLRAISDLVYLPFHEDFEPVAALRPSIMSADTEESANEIHSEIKWRKKTAQMVMSTGSVGNPLVERSTKELFLLHWTDATMARRRNDWCKGGNEQFAQQATTAIGECAEMVRKSEVMKLFSPSMQLAFPPVMLFNQASAEWSLKVAKREKVVDDTPFLEEQLRKYDAAFSMLSLLDRKKYRGPRALALRACLEMSVYLNDPREPRYLGLFATHLKEARRAKAAVQWYLANHIQDIESTLQKSIDGRPGWSTLHNI